MKNIKSFMITILVGILSLFGLYTNVLAETVPKTFKTKDPVILTDYIEGAPKVHYKEIDGGILVYCQNETLVYQGGYTMKLYSQVDDGFIYILENKPNTGDKYKDYYAMQIAIWWYEDLLNNNNSNIPQDVKVSILKKVNTDTYSRIIYNLVNNAKKYKQDKSINLSIDVNDASFELSGNYYISKDIKVSYVGDKVNLTLKNAPKNAEIINKTTKDGVITFNVKVPVSSLEKGKTTTFSVEATATRTIKSAYNYFFSDAWQKIVYGKVFTSDLNKNASISLSINVPEDKPKEYVVKISKTDITGDKEIPGATLNLKGDYNTDLTWVSTSESHKVTLKPGVYKLTETIAPKGYILSKETIEFKLDENGVIYQKNTNGEFTKVDVIKMVNEVRPTINISKLDSKTNKYVSGATLNIKNEKGEVVTSYVTGNESKYVSLEEGVYVLTETAAPSGYKLNTTPIEFKVDADGNLYIKNSNNEYISANGIILYNEPVEVIIPDVPKTGLSSTLTYVVGSLILVGGVIILIKNGKKC